MNWLDLVILIILAASAIKGFFRGFLVEACSLAGFILGIWAGVQLNQRVAEWLQFDQGREAMAFLLIFFAVIAGVHLIGRGLTKVIDVAQLNVPNKLVGVLFGCLSSALTLSVVLNVVLALAGQYEHFTPSKATLKGSVLFEPLRALAPEIVPALGNSKWVERALEQFDREVDDVIGGGSSYAA